MKVVQIQVRDEFLQPVVVMKKGELELLVSIASKNPRTRWIHVSTGRRRVYVSDGHRIIAVTDKREKPEDHPGVSYLVPIGPVKELIKMMKAAHHVAFTRDPKDRALVLALVESDKNGYIGDGMMLHELGKPTYLKSADTPGAGPSGISVEGMEARIEEAIEGGADPVDRKFFLSTEFMVVVGSLPKVVKSHTSELFVGVEANDPLVFQTTGAEGVQWTYYVMPQDSQRV